MSSSSFLKNTIFLAYIMLSLVCVFVLTNENKAKHKLNSSQYLTQHGNLICKKEIESKDINTTANGHLFTKNAFLAALKALAVVAKTVHTKTLHTSLLIPNNDNLRININSYLKVQGELTFDSSRKIPTKEHSSKESEIEKLEKMRKNAGTSFIEVSSIVLNDVKQWQMISEVDMEEVNSKINPFFNTYFFNQNSNEEVKKSNSFEITKTIDINKDFKHLMLETDFSFLNALWLGNTAYIKINGHIYWMEHHRWSALDNHEDELKETCSVKDYRELEQNRWSNPIKIVYRNGKKGRTIEQLDITLGLKLSEKPLAFEEIKKCKALMVLSLKNLLISFNNIRVSIK